MHGEICHIRIHLGQGRLTSIKPSKHDICPLVSLEDIFADDMLIPLFLDLPLEKDKIVGIVLNFTQVC